MREKDNELRSYLNNEILNSSSNTWIYRSGGNYGIPLQELVGKYYLDKKAEFGISDVDLNLNQNCIDPDVVITYDNGEKRGIEVKSCKNGALSGVTICNSPRLINDTDALLINYTFENDTLSVTDVIVTEIFRLITINSRGKYKGCLTSTRDTGKKIKGRNYNSFIGSSPEDDYSLEELTDAELAKRTVLYYSASKLIDDEFNFTDEEIVECLNNLRNS